MAVLEAPGDTAWIVSAALAGRVWVDLTLERADAVRTRGRLDQPAILVDRGGVDRSLRPATREEVSDVFRAHLRPLVERFFWFNANRDRLAGRGESLSLAQGSHRILFDFAVPAMLLAAGELPRPHRFNQRYLAPPLAKVVVKAASRLPSPADGMDTIVRAWSDVAEAAAESLKRACDRWETPWPQDAASRVADGTR